MEIYRGPDQERFEHLEVTIDGELHPIELGDLEQCGDSTTPAWMLLWLFDHVGIRRHPIGAFHAADGRSLYLTRSRDHHVVLALGEVQPGLYSATLEASFTSDRSEPVAYWQYLRVRNPTDLASEGIDFVAADLDYEHCGFDLSSGAGMHYPLPTGTITDLESHGQAVANSLVSKPERRLVPRYLTIEEATPALALPGIPTFLVRNDVATRLGVGGADDSGTEIFDPPIFVRRFAATSAVQPFQ